MNDRKPFSFEYQGVVDEQFAFFPEHIDGGNLAHNLRLKANYPYDYGSRIVGCAVLADFTNAKTNAVIYRIGITCQFQLSEETWSSRMDKSKESVILESEIFTHFAAFTVGTLRGVLHARQSNHPLRVLLPPVNTVALVAQMSDDDKVLRGTKEG